jgi:hypothetical protein
MEIHSMSDGNKRLSPMRQLAACALAGAMIVPALVAHAQSAADGPFADTQALVGYWSAQYPSQSMNILLDGRLVYSRPYGFGPPYNGVYFTCPGESLIRRNCPTEGPFRNSIAIVNYWSQNYPAQSATIYVNGQLVYQNVGFGPPIGRSYVSCPSRGGLMTNCALY